MSMSQGIQSGRAALVGVRRAAVVRLALRYRQWARARQVADPEAIARWAWGLVGSRRYCLVVTDHAHGPAARVVQPFSPREGVIRFGTDPASRKVADVRRTGRCLLVYQDDRRRACVTLECEAVVEEGDGLPFLAAWHAFWPEGPDGSDRPDGPDRPDRDYVVVACRPVALEAWAGTAVIAPEPFGRRSARLVRRGGDWEFDALP